MPRLASLNPFRRKSGRTRAPLVAAVVVTDIVAVAVVVVELSVTEELPDAGVQFGRSEAPDGDEVNAHVSWIVPAYPLLPVTVTVELAELPGLTAAGADALSEYADAVTVTDAVPLPAS
jgi:hypothetical protein